MSWRVCPCGEILAGHNVIIPSPISKGIHSASVGWFVRSAIKIRREGRGRGGEVSQKDAECSQWGRHFTSISNTRCLPTSMLCSLWHLPGNSRTWAFCTRLNFPIVSWQFHQLVIQRFFNEQHPSLNSSLDYQQFIWSISNTWVLHIKRKKQSVSKRSLPSWILVNAVNSISLPPHKTS